MKVVGVVLALCALFLLGKIARELHSINYQLTLATCIAQANRGEVCEAAGPDVDTGPEGAAHAI